MKQAAARPRLRSVVAISLATGTVSLDGGIPNVALPTIAHELGIAGSSAVMIVTVYQLVLVMTLMPLAALGDRIGHRRLLRFGLVLFATAGLLCTFAKSLPMLLLLRAAQAVGSAAVLSVGTAVIRSIYPSAWLGRGLGVNTVIVTSTLALAPTLGGLMLSVLSWNWLFAAAIPMALLSLALSQTIPESDPHDAPYDVVGAMLCAAMFGLVIFGSETIVHGESPAIAIALIGIGALVGFRFVRRELGNPLPILPLDLLRVPMLAIAIAAAQLNFIGSGSLMLTLPFRLQHDYGFSPSLVGAILATWPFTIMIVAPFAGFLSDRIFAPVLGSFGTVLMIAGLVLLAMLPEHPGPITISWRLAIYAAGYSFFVAPTFRLIVNAAPADRAAAAGSLAATNRLTGQTFGASLAAGMLALGVGTGAIPPLLTAALAVVASILGIVQMMPSIRHRTGQF